MPWLPSRQPSSVISTAGKVLYLALELGCWRGDQGRKPGPYVDGPKNPPLKYFALPLARAELAQSESAAMNLDESQVLQGRNGDVAETFTPQPDPTGALSFNEIRRNLYKISCMLVEIYNAVGEQPPCKCEEYRQRLRVAHQKLQGTLEVNRALSMENETLRVKVVQQRRTPAERGGRGGHSDLYKRMEEIESNLHQMMQDTSPSPPTPPPKGQHVVRQMRSEMEEKLDGRLDGKPSLRDRVRAVLFEPGDT